jgi:hypothetical protein
MLKNTFLAKNLDVKVLKGFCSLIENLGSRFCHHIETAEAASVVTLKPLNSLPRIPLLQFCGYVS